MVLLERFTTGRPKKLKASVPCKPHLLFTDGALEYDKFGDPIATINGVLVTSLQERKSCVCWM